MTLASSGRSRAATIAQARSAGYDPGFGRGISVSDWVLLLHVASAFLFVAGLTGRDVTLARARRAPTAALVREFAELAGRFERLMLIPGSMLVLVLGLVTAWVQGRPFTGTGNWWLLAALVIYLSTFPLVPLVFLPRGKVFERVLEEAGDGPITPALAAALSDRAVALARTYERIVVVVVIVLMVTRPF
jgi:hypothetical protein